ncbi:MAG: contractile injection system tape measure protein [Calothrix sp. MO_167.B42]|nr:contractile injection system tape measure protein [Calothrix sp. MO_167.B42]
MKQQQHIIKKQIIELNVNSQQGAFELQNEVSRIYRRKVLPLIDNLLSQFSDSDTIYRINTLEINLENIDINNLEQELIGKIVEQIQQQLEEKFCFSNSTLTTTANQTDIPQFSQQIIKNYETYTRSQYNHFNSQQTLDLANNRASQLEVFSYFIQTGTIPWWAEKLSKQQLEEYCDYLIKNSPNQIKSIVEQNLQNVKQLQRLIYQFPDSTLLKIAGLFTVDLVQFIADYNTDIKPIFEQLEQTRNIPKAKLRLQKWQGIFFSLSSDSKTKVDKFRLIQANLLNITTSNGINYPEFLNNLITKIDHLIKEGKEFKSTLPEILEKIKIPSQETELIREEEVKLLLNELQKLSLDIQISPQYKQQINNLNNEIQILLNEIKNPTLAKNKSNLITRLNHFLSIAQTLKINIQQEINSNQTTIPYSANSFNQSDEIYIYNAGLVLLWPFLNRFFIKIGLVQENVFINTISAERAVLLLQYLVDASIESPEHILPLNKILCGIDLLEPIDTNLEITEQEQSECENLLSAVIQNWSILKNTSIEGFRKAFLQRNGILRVRDGGWLLQVERETYDILLDRIPWSIRVVKLPWMDHILYVEW